MKKVLILAYDFPPYTSMGGQRPFGWYTYFKEFGFEPTVVTRQWPSKISTKLDYSRSVGHETKIEVSDKGRLIYVPYKANWRDKLLIKYGFEKKTGLRKSLTFVQSILQHLSQYFDNKSGIYKIAKSYLNKEKFDYIIATGEPFILFKYAYTLSKKYKTPWIADYRDCWSDNYEVNLQGGINRFLHKYYFHFFERKYVNSAEKITTAAPFFKEQLNKIFPKKIIEIIYNGYVPEQFAKLKFENSIYEKLTIAFAGTIYPFQPLEMFLSGLKLFLKANQDSNVEVVFYGAKYILQQNIRITKFDPLLNHCIKTTDRLSQNELLDKLNKADLLLLFDNKGMISGKLYEYLAMKRVILMAGRDHGSMENIIHDCNAGFVCENADAIALKIEELYQEWKHNGKITCNSKNIEQYSRKAQTKKLAQLLDNL